MSPVPSPRALPSARTAPYPKLSWWRRWWLRIRPHATAASIPMADAFRHACHVANSPLAFVEFDLAGTIISWNPAAARIFGYTSAEALGMNVAKLRSPDQELKSQAERSWAKLIADTNGQKRISKCRHKEGRELIIESFNSPLTSATGAPMGLASVMQDITAITMAELEFRKNERLYKLTYDTPTIGILHLAPSGLILRCNAAYAKMLGYDSATELVGCTIATLTHPDDLSSNQAAIADMVAGRRERVQLEKRYIKRDGSVLHALLSSSFFPSDSPGNDGFLVTAMQDVTAEKIAESSLRQMVSAIESAAIVAETDLNGTITRVNDRFCAVSGYSREELLGQNHRLINSGAHPPAFFADLWRTIMSGQRWTGEIENRNKNGDPYWVQTVIVPLKNLAGASANFLALRFDVTETKKQQQALIEQRLAVANAGKLAALGEMASGIAHEINNPLTVIQGRARIGQSKYADQPEVRASFESIEKMTLRISKIIKSMKRFARSSEADPMEPCLVSTVIADVAELSRSRLMSAGITLKEPAATGDLTVLGRSVQLSQVLVNLVSNAIDAIVEENSAPELPRWIGIEVSSGAELANLGTLGLVGAVSELTPTHDMPRTPVPALTIRVSNSGAPIPAAIRTKIMQPFFTTKPAGKGTGLGLSISTGIIAEHGGRLTLDPDECRTCFVITLPLWVETAVSGSEAAA